MHINIDEDKLLYKDTDQEILKNNINEKNEEIKRLMAEISNLKNLIKSTEVKINAINVTAKEQEVKIGELINAHETEKDDLKHDFDEKSEHFFSENRRLKKENEQVVD